MGRAQMSSGDLPQVYLIRHGETEWSLSGRHTGQTDLPLNETGTKQARLLGKRLSGLEFARVLSSPRQRAQRTCELAGLANRMEVSNDLAEWDYGDYEGLTTAEIVARQSGWNVFEHGCPDGESPVAMAQRADRVVAVLRAARGSVAVFSHGHFLRVLAARWVNWPVTAGQRLLLSTASVSILSFEHDRREEPVIKVWNGKPEP
jgi:broad specificity phosphatase PhoE